MKTNSSNRKFQMLWGIFLIVAMLSCNLNRAGFPTPNKDSGNSPSPSGDVSGNPTGSGPGDDNTLEMPPTAVPATPSQPAWQPQLSPPVLTKALTAGQAQTVDVEGKMKLDFPAGAFTVDPPDLVVSQITGEIPFPLEGYKVLQAYDVALGDLHALAESLEVTMQYDPALLKPDLPAQVQVGAALWDAINGRWTVIPSAVDESAHTVSFKTDHLSVVTIYLHTQMDDYCQTTHFMIHYNIANIDTAAGLMNYKSALKTCLSSASGKNPDFIVAVADYLEAAYAGYVAANFPFPVLKGEFIPVDAAYLQANLLWGDTSQFDTLTGELVITTDPWPNPNELRQDCAHELFHYWQYEKIGAVKYLLNQAWMDATADYAADKVAYAQSSFGPTNSMGKNIRANYLEGSLESNDDYHAYSSSHFVDFLVSQSGDFPTLHELWDATTTTNSALTDLKTYLKTKFNTEFADVYKDFTAYMLFDPASKLPIQSPVWTSKAVNDSMVYRDGMGEVSASATVSGYASILWGLRVDSRKFMSLKWTNAPDEHVNVFFDDNQDQRSGGRVGYYLYANKTASFPTQPETTVYILMVNPSSDSQQFDLTISSSDVEVYSIGVDYDQKDSTCAENAAWGTPPNSALEVFKNGDVTIHYNSATDDYYWSEGAEHKMESKGTGKIASDRLEGSMESTDTIRLGADASGAPVTGTVSLSVSFVMTRRPDMPIYWDMVSAKGSSSVSLPATQNGPAYACSATVKSVSVGPAYYFPLAR